MIKRTAAIITLTSAALGAAGLATTPAQANLPATKVTVANLPSASQIHMPNAHAVVSRPWTGAGTGAEPLTGCQTHTWAAWKPNAAYVRTFSTRVPGALRSTQASVAIASFGTHAAAVKAAAQMAASLRCNQNAAQVNGYLPGSAHTTTRTVTLPSGQVVYLVASGFQSAGVPQVDMAESIGIVATGTHVELVGEEYYAEMGTETTASVLATIKATLPTLAR